jgi:hypothetical protein
MNPEHGQAFVLRKANFAHLGKHFGRLSDSRLTKMSRSENSQDAEETYAVTEGFLKFIKRSL